jgi:hypothetical protein
VLAGPDARKITSGASVKPDGRNAGISITYLWGKKQPFMVLRDTRMFKHLPYSEKQKKALLGIPINMPGHCPRIDGC